MSITFTPEYIFLLSPERRAQLQLAQSEVINAMLAKLTSKPAVTLVPGTVYQAVIDRRTLKKSTLRKNDKLPLSLAGTKISISSPGIHWNGTISIRAGKIIYKFANKIYDSPTAAARAADHNLNGWTLIRFAEGPYLGKTLAEYYDAEVNT